MNILELHNEEVKIRKFFDSISSENAICTYHGHYDAPKVSIFNLRSPSEFASTKSIFDGGVEFIIDDIVLEKVYERLIKLILSYN